MKFDLSIVRSQLDGLLAFVAVAETSSFREAGRRLNVTPPAVSQALRRFEKTVGVQLVLRTTRSVRLSEAGARLFEEVRPAVERLADGMETALAESGQVQGHLRLNIPRPLMPLMLNRLLPDFWVLHPAVTVELVAADGLIDIVGEGFDAGIRFGPVQTDMIAVRFSAPFRLVIIGSPDYIALRGRPLTADDLSAHACVRQRMESGSLYPWTLKLDGRDHTVVVDGPLIVNDAAACIHAALKGLGLAYVAEPLASPYLTDGRLEVLLLETALTTPGLMLYYPRHATLAPKLRAFIDFAAARMRKEFSSIDYFV